MLIKVRASSINPVDWKIMEADHWPAVAGFDLSGVVEAVGSQVWQGEDPVCRRLKVGDEVWADLGIGLAEGNPQLGAWAEYAVAECDQVGLKPESANFWEAAALPLVALTDYQALRQVGAPWANYRTWRNNLTVVVTGGTGGTGPVAIQLAKKYGAKNIITASSPQNHDFLRSLGATTVVDYHTTSIWDIMEDDSVDIVFDNHDAEGTADAAMASLKSHGSFINLHPNDETLSKNPKVGVSQVNFGLVDASSFEDLDALRDHVDAGELAAEMLEWHEIRNIHDALKSSFAGHNIGKIVLDMSSWSHTDTVV